MISILAQHTDESKLGSASMPLQIVFKVSKIRRSVGSSTRILPPICEPRNRYFSASPGTGASIGIAGSCKDTSTLGCYVVVNDSVMALTVDHLVPETAHNPRLTHISEQDRREILFPILESVRNFWKTSIHCCGFCMEFRCTGESDARDWSALDAALRQYVAFERSDCAFRRFMASKSYSQELYQAFLFANLFRKSDARCQFDSTGLGKKEMDWALFSLNSHRTTECLQLLARHRSTSNMIRPPQELHLHELMKSGASIKSLGRTSGLQRGIISPTLSPVFHEEYTTKEWVVVKRPEDSVSDWVAGGIGVDGDSGAIIVDEDDDGIYGMLWARIGEGSMTMTLFTPVREMLQDIRERTGADIELLRGQYMRGSWASDTTRATKGAWIYPTEEKDSVASSLELACELDTHQQSSADTRHPHSFERYRGRDRPNPATLRSVVHEERSEEAEQAQWPGVHTYVRYTMAPEQE